MVSPQTEDKLDRGSGSLRARTLAAGQRVRNRRGLWTLILRRLVYGAVVAFAALTVIFFIGHAIGDPAEAMLPPESPRSVVEALREDLGLDRPLYVQYLDAAAGWVRGDFGESAWQHVPALPLALERLGNTIYLGLVTAAMALPLALGFGLVAGMRPNSLADKLITSISALGASMAVFWLALLLVMLFAVNLKILPSGGYGGLSYVLLPALSLLLLPFGRIAQVTRTAVAGELGQAYVTAARVRGLSDSQIARRHVLKNAAIPVLTITGDEFVTLFNGAVVVESIFSWPGIGQLMLQAIQVRDATLIAACVAVTAVTVILINLLTDVAYVIIDPRVRT